MATTTTLNKYYFGGSSASGSAPTSHAAKWISYTFARPSARAAPDGSHPILIKKVHFKTCPVGQKRKMYGRASYPNGTHASDSLTSTISWQHQAKVTYSFQNIRYFTTEADGSKNVRVWLVSAGEFYFDRNPSATGHIVTDAGHTFSGAPVGWVDYAEVASAPQSVKVTRNAEDPTRALVTWAKESDTGGGTLMGYRLQVAEDAAFTVKLRNYYISPTSYTVTSLSVNSAYYFRVTARNEVSEHYNLPGGTWSATVNAPIITPVNPPPVDPGTSSGLFTLGTGLPDAALTMSLPVQNAMQVAVRSSDTGEFYVTQSRPGTNGQRTPYETFRISRVDATGATLDWMECSNGGHGYSIGLEYDTATGTMWIWSSWQEPLGTGARDDLVRFKYTSGTFTHATAPSLTKLDQFPGVLYTNVSLDWQHNLVAFRRGSGSQEIFELRSISDVKAGVNKVLGTITRPEAPPTPQGFATYGNTLIRLLGAATDLNVSNDPAVVEEYDWRTSTLVDQRSLTGLGASSGGTYPQNHGEPESSTFYYNPTTSEVTLYIGEVIGTAPETYHLYSYVDVADVVSADPGGTDGSDGSGTDPGSGAPGTTDDGGSSDGGNGSTPTPGTGPTIVYTPIPDTSSTETSKGGLLLSKQPRDTDYVVYLMDRGGKKRIGQFTSFQKLTWSRVRNDVSSAVLTLTAEQVASNQETLDRLGTGRSELVVFRGDQRVWEGPITSVQWGRNQTVITAQDICWWLSRTWLHASYSNAYPDQTNAVHHIAGVITAELSRKEAIQPAVNILPYLHTYVEDGDAQTTMVVDAWSMNVWAHLDDMASNHGIAYTVVGRALHIWDLSRAALGRTRTVTEQDFIGDPYVTEYGGDLATIYGVTDGQGGYAVTGTVDPYYGEIELGAQAFGEQSYQVLDPNTGQVIGTTITPAELLSQAERNIAGRNPVPQILNLPDNSRLDVSRAGLGLDVLVAGVYMPMQANLAGRVRSQMQRLQSLGVTVDASGEAVTVSLTPAATVVDASGGDVSLG